MSEALLGEMLPCDPARRVVFRYEPRNEYELHPMKVPEPQPYVPGTWYWFNPGEAPWIVCPRCGTRSRLSNHTVDSSGDVHPSIVCVKYRCGDGVSRCDAHYYGKLEGYKTS